MVVMVLHTQPAFQVKWLKRQITASTICHSNCISTKHITTFLKKKKTTHPQRNPIAHSTEFSQTQNLFPLLMLLSVTALAADQLRIQVDSSGISSSENNNNMHGNLFTCSCFAIKHTNTYSFSHTSLHAHERNTLHSAWLCHAQAYSVPVVLGKGHTHTLGHSSHMTSVC